MNRTLLIPKEFTTSQLEQNIVHYSLFFIYLFQIYLFDVSIYNIVVLKIRIMLNLI
jgi:hypothetical protein